MFISRNSLNVLAYYNSKTKLIRRFEVFFKDTLLLESLAFITLSYIGVTQKAKMPVEVSF